MSGGPASAVFGAALCLPARSPASRSLAEGRRFGKGRAAPFYLWNFRDELPWKRSRSPARLVTHPSEDPPLRGAEKITRVGSSPANPYRRTMFDIEL